MKKFLVFGILAFCASAFAVSNANSALNLSKNRTNFTSNSSTNSTNLSSNLNKNSALLKADKKRFAVLANANLTNTNFQNPPPCRVM